MSDSDDRCHSPVRKRRKIGISPAVRLEARKYFTKLNKPRSPLVCLYCVGKAGKKLGVFTRRVRRHSLDRHFQHRVGPFIRLVLRCGTMISDSGLFSGHAVKVHKTDLV